MATDARDDTQPENSAGSKAAILQIIGNVLVARSLAIVAELGLADLVQTEPQSVTQLAHATGTHADSLYRLLRMLASYGVFAEDDGGLFHPTPMSLLLETDRPDSLRDLLTLGLQRLGFSRAEGVVLAKVVGHGAKKVNIEGNRLMLSEDSQRRRWPRGMPHSQFVKDIRIARREICYRVVA